MDSRNNAPREESLSPVLTTHKKPKKSVVTKTKQKNFRVKLANRFQEDSPSNTKKQLINLESDCGNQKVKIEEETGISNKLKVEDKDPCFAGTNTLESAPFLRQSRSGAFITFSNSARNASANIFGDILKTNIKDEDCKPRKYTILDRNPKNFTEKRVINTNNKTTVKKFKREENTNLSDKICKIETKLESEANCHGFNAASVTGSQEYYNQFRLNTPPYLITPIFGTNQPSACLSKSSMKNCTVIKTEFSESLNQTNSTTLVASYRTNNSGPSRVPSLLSTSSGKRISISNQKLESWSANISKELKPTTSLVKQEKSEQKPVGNAKITQTHNVRRLGSLCRPKPTPTNKMQKAMQIFESECSSPVRKTNPPVIHNSTPLKDVDLKMMCPDLTPIKNEVKPDLDVTLQKVETQYLDRYTIQESVPRSFISWNESVEKEKQKLELQLKILSERQETLRLQQAMENQQRIRCNGILYAKKQVGMCSPLQNVLHKRSTPETILKVNPQNAGQFHFNYQKEEVSYISTLDGARVVPNGDNLVGLFEIEKAFVSMKSVDPKLLPEGWIANHYKWIVWKLASYENFASNMDGCLSVENIIQQLKYRYDVEIDRVQRSCLRKIYETDDIPQKRMVLCVSNIIYLPKGGFEIELTDGWYKIRTIIDEVLSRQIVKGKIIIGTKLITCYAELIGCEGCHPLNATDATYLKIHANSTRRTLWFTKLGYQKATTPFSVKLTSILSNGGVIGCLKVLILRVYPPEYRETNKNVTVWRNQKAEEKRAREWQNQEHDNLKKIVSLDVQESKVLKRDLTPAEIKKILCPEQLYQIAKQYKCPEKLQEIFSEKQMESIQNYQQEEVLRKLRENVNSRDVVNVIRILICDFENLKGPPRSLQIWKPQNVQLDVLKEGSVLYFYNTFPKKNGQLSATSRSYSKNVKENAPEFLELKRRFTPLCDLLIRKPLFNEFDTVGVVISLAVGKYFQECWLADLSMNLLHIKIYESSEKCLLLDTSKKGQLISASNLIWSRASGILVESIANHSTIISTNPRSKHLQEGLKIFKENFPQNLPQFLTDCSEKISFQCTKVSKNHIDSSSFLQSMDSTIFDEESDVFYSSIDVDKYK